MHWFDIVLIGIVGLSIIISFFRGFLREAISLVSWALAIFLALKFAHVVALYIPAFVSSETARYVIAFIGIVLVILVVGMLLNGVVRAFTAAAGIGFFDRLLGLVFGAVRGVLAVAVLLLFIQLSVLKQEPWFLESQLAPKFHPVVMWLYGIVPKQATG